MSPSGGCWVLQRSSSDPLGIAEVIRVKSLARILILAVVVNSNGVALQEPESSTSAAVRSPRQGKVQKVKAEVIRRGVGEKSRVRVKLRDGLELKGFITRIDADSFEVMSDPEPTDSPPAKDRLITLRYADVVKIKGPQPRIASIGTDVGLTIAVVAVLVGLGLLALWEYDRKHRY